MSPATRTFNSSNRFYSIENPARLYRNSSLSSSCRKSSKSVSYLGRRRHEVQRRILRPQVVGQQPECTITPFCTPFACENSSQSALHLRLDRCPARRSELLNVSRAETPYSCARASASRAPHHRNPLVRLPQSSPPVRRNGPNLTPSHKTSHDLRGITAGMRGKTRKIQTIRADDGMLFWSRPLASFAPYSIPQKCRNTQRTCRLTGSSRNYSFADWQGTAVGLQSSSSLSKLSPSEVKKGQSPAAEQMLFHGFLREIAEKKKC